MPVHLPSGGSSIKPLTAFEVAGGKASEDGIRDEFGVSLAGGLEIARDIRDAGLRESIAPGEAVWVPLVGVVKLLRFGAAFHPHFVHEDHIAISPREVGQALINEDISSRRYE